MVLKTENDSHGNHWVQLEITEINYTARLEDANMRPHILWPMLMRRIVEDMHNQYFSPLKDCVNHVRLIRGDDYLTTLLMPLFEDMVVYDPAVAGTLIPDRIVPFDNTTKILVWVTEEDFFNYPHTWTGYNYP